MKRLLITCSLILGGILAFAEGNYAYLDELSPYSKGTKDAYWDTTAYVKTEVTTATSASFNPLGSTPSSATSGSFFDFGIFCTGLSNLLDVLADPAGMAVIIR